MDLVSHLTANSLTTLHSCISIVRNEPTAYDVVVVRLESLSDAIREANFNQHISWAQEALHLIEDVVRLLVNEIEGISLVARLGRPRLTISTSLIEYLLSIRFRAIDIAEILGVSRGTIFGRMRSAGISVSHTYSDITDESLNGLILATLTRFPNTGYKRMKGFLLEEGVKVTDQRVRAAMRQVDPEGVYYRTMQNRCIVRRQYFVSYFNQLWHLDTNMKLIRWNIVIRSCIDGKSRFVTYLDASSDNTAESNLASFLKAVSNYGVPYRTRSDKGGENVLIARFMIEQRGENRGAHICGRSVHNQRIERYWRDVFYGFTGGVYNVLSALEEDGYLDVDNPKHICLVHHVFIPRINQSLEVFRNAWNQHPLSSEHNYSPTQLMVLHLPPPQHDMELGEAELANVNFVCNRIADTSQLVGDGNDSIVSPASTGSLDNDDLERLNQVDILKESTLMGYDIFLECLRCIGIA